MASQQKTRNEVPSSSYGWVSTTKNNLTCKIGKPMRKRKHCYEVPGPSYGWVSTRDTKLTCKYGKPMHNEYTATKYLDLAPATAG